MWLYGVDKWRNWAKEREEQCPKIQWQMEVTCKILQYGIAVWFPHSSIYLTSDMLIESNSWDVWTAERIHSVLYMA